MFVSLCGWAIGVELQPDSAVLTVCYSPDDIAPVTCPDLPVTYLACGYNRRCLPDFIHRPSDLMAVAIQLSAHRGFCLLFDKPLTQPASSDTGELITECFLIDVSDFVALTLTFWLCVLCFNWYAPGQQTRGS